MIYAKVGESFQSFDECLEGFIEMQGERPTPSHVASSDGTWVLPHPTKEQQLAKLESDYQTGVSELQKSLNIAQLRNDIALIADIRNDFVDLQTAYQAEKEAIENVASTETL